MRLRSRIALLSAAAFVLVGISTEAPASYFSEDFTGPLDPAWLQQGEAGSHIGIIGGEYIMTDGFGAPGTTLRRETDGATGGGFIHTIAVTIDPHLLGGPPGAGSDWKWKMFGPDGFMEFVFNGFGDARVFHNDFSGGAGNIQPNTNIGFVDGDLLNLTAAYTAGSDTIDITYSLNGGAAQPFYSGGGIDGPIGDIISDNVQMEIFKFNNTNADKTFASVDSWALQIPEPSAVALFGLGALLIARRRKQ